MEGGEDWSGTRETGGGERGAPTKHRRCRGKGLRGGVDGGTGPALFPRAPVKVPPYHCCVHLWSFGICRAGKVPHQLIPG